jgi:hypothetical protein
LAQSRLIATMTAFHKNGCCEPFYQIARLPPQRINRIAVDAAGIIVPHCPGKNKVAPGGQMEYSRKKGTGGKEHRPWLTVPEI